MTIVQQMLCRTGVALALAASAINAPHARADVDLYLQLGGRAGVEELVALFVDRLHSDPRIGPFFVGGNPAKARERLGAQFCELSGGPCKTIQPDMKKVHSGLDIREADFDSFIELLRQAMSGRGVAQPTQEQFIALLMPMRTTIVNTP